VIKDFLKKKNFTGAKSEAMGLGAGIVGAFNDDKVRQVVNIPPNHEPLLILPVGYKTEGL
jgi:nitroreductase